LLFDILREEKPTKEWPMPITEPHVFGWDEATLGEKLEGLHDWCNILTTKLKAAGEETRALLERIERLENESSLRTRVGNPKGFEKTLTATVERISAAS
jgi:hypothetical protein